VTSKFDVVVIGGGINGLSCVYHLLQRGVKRIALLEQLELLHAKGSSHGYSRITRSTYSNPKYVELIQTAHREDWPALSRSAELQFLHSCPGCFFGPHLTPYLDSLRSVPAAFEQVDLLDLAEGRKRFPFFLFPDSDYVIHDRSCSLIAAAQTMEWFAAYARTGGCQIEERCRVRGIDRSGTFLTLATDKGPIEAERTIVTAGPWTEKLLPQFGSKLRVAHQDVGYFVPQGSNCDLALGAGFPVWVYAGREPDESFYGLPQYVRPGIKLARHRTGSHKDNPDRSVSLEMPAEVRLDLEDFAARQLAFPVESVGYEACLYTNTPEEDFILDHYPGDDRIVIGAGFSGHGFKFGPLTGRILVGLLLDGHSGVEAFEKCRSLLSLAASPDFQHRGDAGSNRP
jgi:sarcosine oxidase